MACFASVASFQAKWKIEPCEFSSLFFSINTFPINQHHRHQPLPTPSWSLGLCDIRERLRNLPSVVPALRTCCVRKVRQTHAPGARSQRSTRWIHSRWQRVHLQPAHRVRFHLVNRRSRADTRLYRFITTISAWTEPGCKNADNDPYASLGDSFKSALPGWCETKKAGAIFFWLAFGVFIPRDAFFGLTRLLFSGFWLASFILLILDWRAGNLGTPPRDPPFTRPDADVEEGEEDEEGEHSYQPVANTIPTYPRQSTYDNSNATASPFADTNRLSTAPTNTSTTRLSTAQPTTNRLRSRLEHQPHISIFHCTYHHYRTHNQHELPCLATKYGRVWRVLRSCPKWVWRRIDDIHTSSVGPSDA
jgi:hypothetical protein